MCFKPLQFDVADKSITVILSQNILPYIEYIFSTFHTI